MTAITSEFHGRTRTSLPNIGHRGL